LKPSLHTFYSSLNPTSTLFYQDQVIASIAMRTVFIPESTSNSIDVQIAHANMVFDPRHMGLYGNPKFSFSVKGRTLTITRTDEDDEGWTGAFRLRDYLPTEDIPDFTVTVYTYHGLRHEYVPQDVTKAFIHPSVRIIKEYAFWRCKFLERVTIPDTVTRIEQYAFHDCHSLRFMRLPTNLEFIGDGAFRDCKSLEAAFLPPTVTHIGDQAFEDCTSLRF